MNEENLPPYAFVPGGPWPHPSGSPDGHSFGLVEEKATAIQGEDWRGSPPFVRGVALFNAGYYWEAHEAWESLWHVHGRKGATADFLKGLIKLAAAGVKVREGQPHGIITHARRAATLFAAVRKQGTEQWLGLDLRELESRALEIAEKPPLDLEPPGTRVSIVLAFRLEPR